MWGRANNNHNNPRNSSFVLADGSRGAKRPAYGSKRKPGAGPGARHGPIVLAAAWVAAWLTAG